MCAVRDFNKWYNAELMRRLEEKGCMSLWFLAEKAREYLGFPPPPIAEFRKHEQQSSLRVLHEQRILKKMTDSQRKILAQIIHASYGTKIQIRDEFLKKIKSLNAERDTSDPAPTAKLVEREIGEMASYIRSQNMWTLFERFECNTTWNPRLRLLHVGWRIIMINQFVFPRVGL